MSTVSERPILFSAPMVRAILAGEKTQTRRIVKPQPPPGTDQVIADEDPAGLGALCLSDRENGEFPAGVNPWRRCPYGATRDRLWVRESFRLRADQDHKPPSDDWWKSGAWHDADVPRPEPTGCGGGPGKLRPAIFMPRWASRITLEVTGVRVERLQAINDHDARAEGLSDRERFEQGWDTINGKRAAWASNPWVWIVEFERLANRGSDA